MKKEDWKGVIPAITTPFNDDLSLDLEALSAHVTWMLDSGCRGVVALGSLGEAATLTFDEKLEILKTCVAAAKGAWPVVAGIASLTTREAVSLAKAALDAGCGGLMVLPPYVYQGDWRETESHVGAIISATSLSCMLYNNPIAYGTDFTPEQIKELAEKYPNLHAVKESSGDVRRLMAIRGLINDRLSLMVGVDDVIVESIAAGASGWIAGLVNAFPAESVKLFDLAMSGNFAEAVHLYGWFLPLLRMDTVPKFVQLIKLVQFEVGRGSARVRPPRMELSGSELSEQLDIIHEHMARRAQSGA